MLWLSGATRQLLITFVMSIFSPLLHKTSRSREFRHEREQFHLWKQGDFQVLFKTSVVSRLRHDSR